MVCPPVPAILNLNQSDDGEESESDADQDEAEAEETRSACMFGNGNFLCQPAEG